MGFSEVWDQLVSRERPPLIDTSWERPRDWDSDLSFTNGDHEQRVGVGGAHRGGCPSVQLDPAWSLKLSAEPNPPAATILVRYQQRTAVATPNRVDHADLPGIGEAVGVYAGRRQYTRGREPES